MLVCVVVICIQSIFVSLDWCGGFGCVEMLAWYALVSDNGSAIFKSALQSSLLVTIILHDADDIKYAGLCI